MPKWAGGPYEPPPLPIDAQPAALLEAMARTVGQAVAAGKLLSNASGGVVSTSGPASIERGRRHGAQRGRRGKRRGGGGGRRVGRGGYRQLQNRQLHSVPDWPLPHVVPATAADEAAGGPAPSASAGGGGGPGDDGCGRRVCSSTDGRDASAGAAGRRVGGAAANNTFAAITTRTCLARGLSLMTLAECVNVAAHTAGYHFIGSTLERREFPGCVRWAGGFVEFNGHTDQTMGCNIGGAPSSSHPPACLCKK